MKILQVADRPGWAIDRLSKPLTQMRFENIQMDMAYVNTSRKFLPTGYTPIDEVVDYQPEKCLDYDLIHFHIPMVTYDSRFKTLNPKTRKVLTVHNEYYFREDEMEKRDKQLIDWSLFDDIIAPTKYCYEEMKKKHKRVHYVPHGIDLKQFNYSGEAPEPKTIGYVGRIMKHKRFGILLNACKFVDLKVVACGYIDKLNVWKNAMEEASPRNYVFYTFLPESQLSSFYGSMVLFTCLSEPKIEVGPLPVLEAMACGVPVISTEVGWAKDWCKHGENIWFIEEETAKDSRKLNKEIKRVYDDDKLKRKLRGGALRLIKDFSIENYAKKLIEIYEK